MAELRQLAERAWYSRAPGARLSRAALLPLSWTYRAVTGARNALYDAGVLRSHPLALPAISVGNLTVGGTGKTPIAAWLARELAARGRRPAVVLRGYGDDEPAVHATLNPGAVVVADPDRVAGVKAAAGLGADVAVLDDAFQHRRARRDVDVVLVSADRWPDAVNLLPAGPFREGTTALARASLVVVTRKAASVAAAVRVEQAIAGSAPGVPIARAWLAPGALVDVRTGVTAPLDTVAGRPVIAICGVGDPEAFAAQLAGAGAAVTLRAFPDHHAFDDGDVASLVRGAAEIVRQGGLVVCTLKDAVKLGGRWPGEAVALSYISQQVILEVGRDAVDRLLDSLPHARGPAAAAAS